MLHFAERRFTRISENIPDAPPLTSGDAVVQVLKCPVQPLCQSPTYARLARSHEANKEHGAMLAATSGPLFPCGSGFSRDRTLLGTVFRTVPAVGPSVRIAFLRYCDFAVRFLRWILPLKLRRTTVDDTAARPIVPMKVRPSWKVSQE